MFILKLIDEVSIMDFSVNRSSTTNSNEELPTKKNENNTIISDDADEILKSSHYKAIVKTANETNSYVNQFFSGCKNLVSGAYHKITSIPGQAKSFAVQIVLNTALSTATWGVNYQTEIRKYSEYIKNKISFSGMGAILHPLADQTENFIWDQIFPKESPECEFAIFLNNNKAFINEFITLTLFKLVYSIIDSVYEEWKKEPNELPFAAFLINQLLKKYDQFENHTETIKKIGNPENRIDAWKEKVGKPFIKALLNDFLPHGIESSLPLSKIGKWGATFVIPGMVNSLTNYVAYIQEFLHNSEKEKNQLDEKKVISIFSYKSNMPLILAKVGAEYAKSFVFAEIKNELHQLPIPGLSNKCIEKITKYFENNELEENQAIGKRTAEYIRSRQLELSKLLLENIEKSSESSSMKAILKIATDFIEKILLKIFLEIHQTITTKESEDPAVLARAFIGLLRNTKEKLESVNLSKNITGLKENEKEQLGIRLLKRLGITKETAPIPELFKNEIWQVITIEAFPSAFSSIVNAFATEKDLKKLVFEALDAYKSGYKEEEKTKKEALKKYRKEKAKAMKTGKKIPNKPVFTKKALSIHNIEVKDELTQEFTQLLDQIAFASKNKLFRKALSNSFVKYKVAKSLANSAYDRLTDRALLRYGDNMGASIIKLTKLKNAEIETKKVNGISIHTIKDRTTHEEIKDFKFKIVKKSPIEIERKIKNRNEKIDNHIKKIGSHILLSPIRRKLKKMWFNFQDLFDRAFNKIPFGGKVKLFLDAICRYAFDYTLGILIHLIHERLKKTTEDLFSNSSKDVLESLTKAYDPDYITKSTETLLNSLEK